jgi:tetratricopeptide (TPR) repeat protein
MDTESIISHCDRALRQRTGRRLSELQRLVLQQVYQGQKYREIADDAGYTEGHIKDVGSDLWKLLSQAFDTKFTKSNCKAAIKRSLLSTGLYKPEQFIPPIGDTYRSSTTPDVMPLSWAEMAFEADLATVDEVTDRANRNFLGRSTALTQLAQFVQQGHPIVVIQGAGGLGKTTLAQHFLYQSSPHGPSFDLVLELLMAKETRHITPADRVVAEWLKQDFGVEPGTDFGVSLGRLQRQLQQRRVGILIDNLEPALDAQGQFLPEHRQYLELLRVLSLPRTQCTTLITSRDRLGEVDANLVHYRLPGLSPATWMQFLQAAGLTGASTIVEARIVEALCHAYGGNAKAMGLIGGTVQTDFDGDLAAYWQTHQTQPRLEIDLAQLVASQMQRLQQLDPAADRLLQRLSCYHYQAVPRLPIGALTAMLWDQPSDRHGAMVQSLQSRSLLEFHKGQYWLHPVVREVAIAQLRQTPDWQQANTAAAGFWTQHIIQIQTKQDALAALEAYHQYIAIHDYENAAQVILKSRHNQWYQHLPLGSTLYRMGLVEPVLKAIATVIAQVKAPIQQAELHNILGDLQWISGNIPGAIDCQNQTIALTTATLAQTDPAQIDPHQLYRLKMLEVDAKLSLGLYHIDLWELAIAAQQFEQVITTAQNTAHDRWAQKAQVCLAYVLAQQGECARSRELANAVDRPGPTVGHRQPQSGSFAYFWQILGQTYAHLGDPETAQTCFTKALTSAETGEYPQVKARTLNSLAQLHRHQGEIDYAHMLHTEAIALLEGIGAQCDLAEAHWQCSLTAQIGGDVDLAQQQFEIAQNLFATIPAPQQLIRINHPQTP